MYFQAGICGAFSVTNSSTLGIRGKKLQSCVKGTYTPQISIYDSVVNNRYLWHTPIQFVKLLFFKLVNG